MLTPFQVRDKVFQASGRNAYKSEDVDRFMEEVGSSYEQMFKENSELIKRVSLLAEKLEQYKKDEDSIKSSVLTAQKAAQNILEEAKAKAAEMTAEADDVLKAAESEASLIASDAENKVRADLSESISAAETHAQQIIADAKKQAEDILLASEEKARDRQGAVNRTVTSESLYFDMLKKEVSEFRKDLLAKYKAHIELITELPALAVQEAEKLAQETPAEAAPEETPAASEETEPCECAEDTAALEQTDEPAAQTDADNEVCAEEACENEFVAVPQEEEQADIEFISEPADEEPAPLFSDIAPAKEEYVEHADIPFDFNAPADLEFVSDAEEEKAVEPAVDVNDFIANFEEPPVAERRTATASRPAKKGFKIDLTLIDDDDEAQEPAAADTVVDDAAETKPVSHDDDENGDDAHKDILPAFLDNDEHPDLKKRFTVIRSSDMADVDDDDDYDDDDDEGGSPLKGLFKKKK